MLYFAILSVCVEHLLLHKGDAYRSVTRYGYCVSCTILYGLYHDTLVHQCIVPALVATLPNTFLIVTVATLSDNLLIVNIASLNDNLLIVIVST